MAGPEDKFYVVRADILPEGILKTAQVKEILARGEARTINQAVARVGLSRSAYYKYKDGVFPLNRSSGEKMVTLSLNLEHASGVLSRVLNLIASSGGNILTINQNLPLQGLANVNLTLETTVLTSPLSQLMDDLSSLDGVRRVEITGQS